MVLVCVRGHDCRGNVLRRVQVICGLAISALQVNGTAIAGERSHERVFAKTLRLRDCVFAGTLHRQGVGQPNASEHERAPWIRMRQGWPVLHLVRGISKGITADPALPTLANPDAKWPCSKTEHLAAAVIEWKEPPKGFAERSIIWRCGLGWSVLVVTGMSPRTGVVRRRLDPAQGDGN